MSVLGNFEYGWTVPNGRPFKVRLGIKASQTVRKGDLVQFSSGQIQRVAAASAAIDTSAKILGILASDNAYPLVNGTRTSAAANTLVDVMLWDRGLYWNAPTYGATPAITNFGTSYAGYNDAGIYKLDVNNTTNPSFVPFALDLKDAYDGSGIPKFLGTLVVGMRMNTVILDAGRQVIF